MTTLNTVLLTPEQIDLARHALGLNGRPKVSYRNRFVCGRGHFDYDDWTLMVVGGFAKCWDGQKLTIGGDDCFYLTRLGAEQALQAGERLCEEDFPTWHVLIPKPAWPWTSVK